MVRGPRNAADGHHFLERGKMRNASAISELLTAQLGALDAALILQCCTSEPANAALLVLEIHQQKEKAKSS